jgi:hypothetical protein
MNRLSAAAENDRCSTAARKYVSCWSVIGETFRCCSQSSVQRWLRASDTGRMLTLLSLAVGAVFALIYQAEDRPGFDERAPLS